MCIEKSHYKFNKLVTILLKAVHKLAKDWLGQPSNLVFCKLAQRYLQACDKPTESCFFKQTFVCTGPNKTMFFIFKNYLSFIVSLIFFIFNANYLCFIFGVLNRLSISFSSVFSCWTLFFSLLQNFFSLQNFQFIQFIEYKFWVVTYEIVYYY